MVKFALCVSALVCCVICPPTSRTYTLSLHDALPISGIRVEGPHGFTILIGRNARDNDAITFGIARSRDIWLHVQGYRGSHVIIRARSEEHTSELQSRGHLVCRLLLEKKNRQMKDRRIEA